METTIKKLSNLLEEIGLDFSAIDNVFEEGIKGYDADTLYDRLNDNGAFDNEFIYLKDAQDYLFDNDGDLSESLKIAGELGFRPEKLDIYVLAYLLNRHNCQDAYYEHKGEIECLLNEINKE